MSKAALPIETITKVKDLLTLRISQRDIAFSVGIGQSTVNKIKKGYYDSGKFVLPKAKADIFDFSNY